MRVAFARDERGQSSVYLLDIARGEERLLLERIGRHTSWTPDGNGILYYAASPIQWKIVDVETGQSRDLGVVHPRFPVHSLQLSPDQAWVSFKLQGDTGSPLFVARLPEGSAPDQAGWVSLGESGSANAGHNWWSPDGRTLYYLTDRDGFLCIAAQALDAATKAPRGQPVFVQHFHGRLRTPPGAPFGFGLTGTRLYFPLRETKANIWLAEPRTLP
jgi:Tol biopolymer transport system component